METGANELRMEFVFGLCCDWVIVYVKQVALFMLDD